MSKNSHIYRCMKRNCCGIFISLSSNRISNFNRQPLINLFNYNFSCSQHYLSIGKMQLNFNLLLCFLDTAYSFTNDHEDHKKYIFKLNGIWINFRVVEFEQVCMEFCTALTHCSLIFFNFLNSKQNSLLEK